MSYRKYANRLRRKSRASVSDAGLGGGRRRSPRIEALESRRVLAGADSLEWRPIESERPAEGVGEIFEIMLNARTTDDELITADENGKINVTVNEPFELEISYDDLRRFGQGIGLFQLMVDIGVSKPGVLEPILNESQRFLIGSEYANHTSGSLVFGLEGTATTYESDILDFREDPRSEIVNAMSEFGYSPQQYTLKYWPHSSGKLTYDIHYVGDEFADIDLPNISITADLPSHVTVDTVEYAPRNPDGTVNGDAVRYNVNALSRTFENNQPFFASLNFGGFGTFTGFTNVGGTGPIPAAGGGVQNLTSDGSFTKPFDAFSLRVKIISEVTDFVLTARPGSFEESVLAYGMNDAVQPDQVLIDDDAVLTINAAPANRPPTVSQPIVVTTNEDQPIQTVDLLSHATDPDGDSLTIRPPDLTSQPRGIEIIGSQLTFDPNAYDELTDGQREVIELVYDVVDVFGASTRQSMTLRIDGITDVITPPPDDPIDDPAAIARYDVSGDNDVSAHDAIQVINAVSRAFLVGHASASDAAMDVNGDGRMSSLDALLIINYLTRRNTPAANAEAESSSQSDDHELAVDWWMSADIGLLF